MALIRQAGARALHFPVIEIRAVENREQAAPALQSLGQCYALIFISRNAVTHAFRLAPALAETMNKAAVIAVGAGTREALFEHGVSDVIASIDGSGSEALLRLPVLQAQRIRAKKIMIVRGEGGRELLRQALSERGAQLSYAEVYRRTLPALSRRKAKKLWRENRPDVIVVTSVEALHNLIRLINKAQHAALFNTPLVVPGRRIQEQARNLGFVVMPYAQDSVSDEGLLHAVLHSLESKQR